LGARQAKYYVGTDRSKQFMGWHDSMIDQDGGFQSGSDGQVYTASARSSGPGTTADDARALAPVLATRARLAEEGAG